jgi:hypothetical protein
MRIFISLFLFILIINSMVSESLHAENPDAPVDMGARINLCASETGITSKIVLNTSFPGTGWDIRFALNQSAAELPEIFLRYNHLNFLSQFGSMYISGLLHYLENPFSVNDYEDFLSPVSVSLIPVPLAVMSNSRKYPEVLLGWKMQDHRLFSPATLYAYSVPPGLNKSAHYRAGLWGTSNFQNQTIQIGTLLHGLQSSDKFLDDSEWYPAALKERADSREGFSGGFTLFRKNEYTGSGIIGLVSLDPCRKSGFMAGSAISLKKGLLSISYFQSIYSPSYPIIFSESSSNRAVLHTGTVLLELPKLLNISMEVSEELDSIDWNFIEGTEAERSFTTEAEIELGIVVIKIKDFLLYSYLVKGQEVTVDRVLNTDCIMDFGALKIVTKFSAEYTNRHLIERDKRIELSVTAENISCSYKIDFTGDIQESSIELKFTLGRLQFSINAVSTGKYQATVSAEI